MKRIVTLLLAVSLCLCSASCASNQKSYEYLYDQPSSSPAPKESASSTKSTDEETDSIYSEFINLSGEKGSILFMGCEAADHGSNHGSNGIFFQFRFLNRQEQAAACSSVFFIQAFQDGVELASSHWASEERADQNALYQTYRKEVPAGQSAIMGCPAILTSNSPVILRIQEAGNKNNAQWMRFDLQELNISVEEDHRFDTDHLTPLPNAINLSSDRGSLMYVGAEPAVKDLSDLENLLLVSFVYTNQATDPSPVYSAYRIKCYQNNVELPLINAYYLDPQGQHLLVGRYYRSVLENSANLFAMPLLLTDDSPVTIIAEDFSDPGNYQIMELSVKEILP